MKIAVVGTGIAGMVAAYLLAREHELTVFEAEDYVGGHTHTVAVEDAAGPAAVDTGFIVYNEWTYPNFCKLLARLGVATQPSDMSFSVRDEADGLEYKGDNLNTLFAQRRNLLRPRFYRMLADIVRFYRGTRRILVAGDDRQTIGAYLAEHRYSAEFVEKHLIPMGAAIWSADPHQFQQFPIRTFVRFCHNHGMLNFFRRPQWRVVTGGSQRYVEKLTASYADRIHVQTPVTAVRRSADGVELVTARFGPQRFDHIVLAVHSDQALALLADPSSEEREILGAMKYQPNIVTLHTDTRLLPKSRRAWASWNYDIPAQAERYAMVTYNMNMLQSLRTQATYCVSLNSADRIAPETVRRQFEYQHPVYTVDSVAAQRRHAEISGIRRTHFCGAYWGFGFHEDGVNSALVVARAFGQEL